MKQTIFQLIIVLTIIIAPFSSSKAVKAYPHPITIEQKDGTTLTIRLHGDEFFRYRTTEDGFLIKEGDDGIYRFATHDKLGNINASKVLARNKPERTIFERTFTAGLEQNPNFSAVNNARRAQKVAANTSATQTAFPLTGSPRSIAILVNFKDKNFVTGNPKQAFERMLNQQGYSDNGGTGSARDYFIESSFGAFAPQFDVVGPFDLPQNMSFYGGNNSQDDDQNPRQMIIDACKAAEAAGVDFKIYDTDNDGILDNVFVFYAGYNEAEGGPKETVWPHRWSMSNYNNTVSGKIIFDYACTSELRGNSGSNMAGIGTFTHEFGHVLGLPDYYPTDGGTHYTTGNWHIMDGGAYNNSGRTPPSYSAFDRFFLNWLVPTELKTPVDVVLPNLVESNEAYIITQNGNHNMVGNNPNPVEFFVLENRQRVGFDAYLPGKGMLITRIFYNSTTWRNNEPNNNASALGYDIIEADGIASNASQAGDPFPGSTNRTSYNPTLRNGTNIEKPLTEISEENGIIKFLFMGGGSSPQLKLFASTSLFSTEHGTPSDVQTIEVSGSQLINNAQLSFKNNLHFEMRLAGNEANAWVKSLNLSPTDSVIATTQVQIRYNPSAPSILDTHSETLQLTSEKAMTKLANISGKSTRPIFVVKPTTINASDITFASFVANWNSVFDASGYYFTAYSITDIASKVTEGFDNGLSLPTGWDTNATATTNSSTFSGKAIPAIQLRNTDDYIETETFVVPATKLSVYVRSIGATGGNISIKAWNESQWTTLESFASTTNLAITKTYSFDVSKNYKKFRIEFVKGSGNISIDDFEFGFEQRVDYMAREKWTTKLTDTLRNLVPNTKHYFKVKASDKTFASDKKTLLYENITEWSDIAHATTLDDPNTKVLRANVHNDGTITVILSNNEHPVYVYSSSGQLIRVVESPINIVEIKGLARQRVYILQSGTRRAKVIL